MYDTRVTNRIESIADVRLQGLGGHRVELGMSEELPQVADVDEAVVVDPQDELGRGGARRRRLHQPLEEEG